MKIHAVLFAICLWVIAWGLVVVVAYLADPAGVGCCH